VLTIKLPGGKTQPTNLGKNLGVEARNSLPKKNGRWKAQLEGRVKDEEAQGEMAPLKGSW